MIGLLLAVALPACVKYQPLPISSVRNSEEYASRSLRDPGLLDFLAANHDSPEAAWDLSSLTLAAFYFHPDLDLARARWSVARAGVITAGQRPNPAFGLNPTFNANAAPGISPWTLGLNLDLPVEIFGKRGYRIAQARMLTEAARLSIASVAWHVRDRLRNTFIDLWAATARTEALNKQQQVQTEIVSLLERRLAVGEASRIDVTRERLSLERMRVNGLDSWRQSADARARLAGAVGIPAAALDTVQLLFNALSNPPRPLLERAGLYRTALQGRSDVLAALAEYRAREAALQLEIARQYPDIHLGPGYTWDQGDNKYTLGLSVALPVLNRNQGPIAEAIARRREVAVQFEVLQDSIVAEIDRSLAAHVIALRVFAAADSQLIAALQRQREIDLQFRVGEIDRLAVLAAKLEVAASVLLRAEMLYHERLVLGQLESAIQQPLLTPRPPQLEHPTRTEKL